MTIDTPSTSTTADKVGKVANGAADKAETKISKLAERAEKAAQRAETVLNDGIETLRTQARSYADTATEKWDSTTKAVEDHVREKPLQGIAIAAGVGLIIGLLLGSRRN